MAEGIGAAMAEDFYLRDQEAKSKAWDAFVKAIAKHEQAKAKAQNAYWKIMTPAQDAYDKAFVKYKEHCGR